MADQNKTLRREIEVLMINKNLLLHYNHNYIFIFNWIVFFYYIIVPFYSRTGGHEFWTFFTKKKKNSFKLVFNGCTKICIYNQGWSTLKKLITWRPFKSSSLSTLKWCQRQRCKWHWKWSSKNMSLFNFFQFHFNESKSKLHSCIFTWK